MTDSADFVQSVRARTLPPFSPSAVVAKSVVGDGDGVQRRSIKKVLTIAPRSPSPSLLPLGLALPRCADPSGGIFLLHKEGLLKSKDCEEAARQINS